MGHREDLLDGAVRCIYEKGYGRTTARDIVAASGTNLGSIGYHYGSTEALLNAALTRALEEWGTQLAAALTVTGELDAPSRFEAYWAGVIASIDDHRPALKASFDAFVQMDHAPAIQVMIAEGIQDARGLWASVFHGIDPETEPEKAFQVGSFYQALITGVLTQWLVDPANAPTGHDLAEALRTIARSL